MTDELKRKVLIFFVLAAITVLVIAAALPQLDLQPGIPLPISNNSGSALPQEIVPLATISVSTLFMTILGVIALLILGSGGYRLLRGASLRDIGPTTLYLTLVTLIGAGILFALSRFKGTAPLLEAEIPAPSIALTGAPLGPPSTGFLWAVWAGLAAAVILLVVWFYAWRTRQNRTADLLRLEAKRAVQALQSGADLRSVIVQCYQQMTLLLQKEQGIALEETMTAREFERLLRAKGAPPVPVRELTRLFEAARYGSRPPSPGDEQAAFDCLNAIARFSRERSRPS